MELWFMESVAFGCIAVGVCAILYCIVRVARFLYNYQYNDEIDRMREQLKAKDEQIIGLRSKIESFNLIDYAEERENKN